MPKHTRKALIASILLLTALAAGPPRGAAWAQAPSADSPEPAPPAEVKRSVKVMDFGSLISPTTIVFRPTALVSGSQGEAEVWMDRAVAKLHATFTNLPPASRLGREYLTYVLWSVTPEGRTTNLGEVTWAGAAAQLDAKVEWHRFGLLVTAEPYFAVSMPGAAVVFEAGLAPGATNEVPITETTCQLLSRPTGGAAVAAGSKAAVDPTEPLVVEEARRAIAAAKAAGAEHYAPLTFGTATQLLRLAENQLAKRVKLKDVLDTGSEAVLIAEDARVLATARQKRLHDADPPLQPSP
ncbi:MAG TPA: hypothetical protein VL523_16030 [Terriglobia bacterium]|nr:hypothetical protein [Terriglobia bacterium]